MKIEKRQRLVHLIPLLLLGSIAWQSAAQAANCEAGSTCVFGSSGGQDNSLTKEQAREQREQWDQTRPLRSKVNTHVEKAFDKADRAIEQRERCERSLNVNAYWERYAPLPGSPEWSPVNSLADRYHICINLSYCPPCS